MSSRGEQTVGIEILPEGGGEPELALAGKQQQRESCFRVYSLEFALLAGDREWLVARLKDLVGKSDEKSRGEFDNLIRYRDTLLKEEDQRLKAEDQRLKALELSQKATKDIEELRLKAEGLSLRKQEMDLQQQNSGKCSHQIGHLVALHALYFPCPTQRPRNQQEAHPTCHT